MVLQQQPEQAAVYGYLGNTSCNGKTSGCISVTLKDGKGTVVKTVDATITLTNATTKAYRWKALLPPTATGGPYSITAACAAGAPCNDTVTIDDVMFGEVWFCAGQSNMWLTNWYTFSRNASLASVRAGNYNNIRVAAGDSQCPPNDQGGPHCNNLEPASGDAAVFPWYPAQDAATINISAFNYLPPFAKDREAYLFDVLSATCWSFAEALTDQLKASGKTPPPIGIVNVAIGGSQIEEWMPVSVSQQCAGAALQSEVPQQLWETIVWDNFVDMTVKGWLWYQGENNAGSLHGNFGTQSGYGCTMPALIKYWREQWSATPGTTAATAPFGLVSLSPDDSEGSPDMGSFRWAQSGGFGVVPNSAMPNVFMAHAYDLADPYESGSHCSSSGDIYCQCNTPGMYSTDYGCYTPNWMGPLVRPLFLPLSP
jgi:sialate O-acetylesterase